VVAGAVVGVRAPVGGGFASPEVQPATMRMEGKTERKGPGRRCIRGRLQRAAGARWERVKGERGERREGLKGKRV
jgi:hypothetical protein